jgi:hypothetical protein
LIIPIRHHSPISARAVRQIIFDRRPRLVLIEGPADASELIPLLADPSTIPPIAIYGYRQGAEGRAVFYPFCAYSPELVALQTGLAVGAKVRFCDVPTGVALDWEDRPGAPAPAEADNPPLDYAAFASRLSDAAGMSSFEELWEACFEQEAREPAELVALTADFGEKARQLGDPIHEERDALRERLMASAVRDSGLPTEGIVLVCGAAHAAPIRSLLRANEPSPPIAASAPAEISLIPFSYPRLSEQSGYGAGNRAPAFYQSVWEHDNDYAASTRRALVLLAWRLRARGRAASLAQCIDGANLAASLARLRGKVAPGVDELLDVAPACFGEGSPLAVLDALREVLIGEAVGRVSQKVGKTPLQLEFYATANRLGVPVVDAPRQILVHLTSPREARQSIFFHRLAIADVPFARELESGVNARRATPRGDSLEQLARVREKWEIQWSPATDGALVERTAWGNTLAEVVGRLLRQKLERAGQVDAATNVLLRLVLCDLVDDLPAALTRCKSLAADSVSFPALARASYHLDGLLAYGAARHLPSEALVDLAARLFARAALHLPQAVSCGDDAAVEVERSLISLHELVRRESSVAEDSGLFWESVERSAEITTCHSALRGLCLTLQELAGRLDSGELAGRLRFWLSQASDAADNARLVTGLFALHRGTLVRNRSLIAAVTEFLDGLDLDRLIPLLPVLRRTLGNLSPAERAYLSETLCTVLGLTSKDPGELTLSDEELERVRAADTEVAAVLDRWRMQYDLA